MTSKGYRHSEETKRKMSETRRGKNNPNYGKKHSEESKKLMSQNRKGKCVGTNNPNYGKPKTANIKLKISKALKGKYKGEKSPHYGKPKSAEHRRKISESRKGKYTGKNSPNYGRKWSAETRRKMGLANIGKKHSDETRRKLSESRMGEKNHAWKGGISFEPYSPDFNNILKRQIRERDEYVCQWCKDPGKYVHHIDGDHKNSNPWNLITLCLSCNAKEQYHREKMMPIFYEITKKHNELTASIK